MIGQMLLHYKIIERLGQGGMGIVYKAQDTHLDRFVAIKVLPQDKVSDPDRRRRFIQEAKAASALNHPNIVTIHDIDETNGVHFIAMEYIEGETLGQLISRKELQLDQSLEYAAQIAGALSKAHSAGIVHRDLKPSNIMVTPEGLVKVLDFGLAKLTESPSAPDGGRAMSSLPTLEKETSEGMILGTLPFMSPEQARGQEVDYRTDIFSLGVVLYYMITGELPFVGRHAAAILDKLLYSPTPSLKGRSPQIPYSLEQTIARATAKDPCDRYQSMKDMVVDLRSPSGESAPAALSSRPYGNRRFRRRFMVLALVLAICVLQVPFRGFLPRWLGGPARLSQMRLAVLPFENIGSVIENLPVCDGLMEILATKLIQVGQFQNALSVVPANEIRSEKVTSASRARRTFGANLVLTGSVQRLADKFLLTINLVDTTTLRQIDGKICMAGIGELLTLQDDAFERAVSMLALKVNPTELQALNAGETRVPAAYNFYVRAIGHLARYDVSENVNSAVNLFQQAITADPRYALAYAGLGEAYWRKFRRTREKQWADAALTNCLRAVQFNNSAARVHLTLGMVFTGTGQPEKAVEELNRAIGIEPKSAEAYRELGRAFEAMNKLEDAERSYSRAIQMQPDSWSCIWNLGVFYYNRTKYEQAAEQFLKVIQLTPDHYRAYLSLGAIYVFQGKFAQAAEMFDKSLALKATPDAYSNLGASFILQRHFSEAVPALEKAVGMEGAGYEVWGNLADAYAQTPGLSAKAPAAYARAAALAGEDLEVNPKNSTAKASLAFYSMKLGNKSRALEEIRQACTMAPGDPDVLFWAALVYELAGYRDKALISLAAAAAGGYSLPIIRAAFELDRLRNDPRYHELVERSGTL